jgi:hypothetical protein
MFARNNYQPVDTHGRVYHVCAKQLSTRRYTRTCVSCLRETIIIRRYTQMCISCVNEIIDNQLFTHDTHVRAYLRADNYFAQGTNELLIA